jgi:heme oxygenase
VSVTLAARLRAGTSALHTRAERTPFMAALMGGRLDRYGYCLMLRNLESVYVELERALLRHAGHAQVAPVVMPVMFRTSSLQQDLHALHGAGWALQLPLLPACTRYTDRLKHLAEADPVLLAAHVYVRYLGDLSGGQMLQRVVARGLDLAPGDQGMAFLDFGAPQDVAKLAGALRAGMDEVARAGADEEALIAEATWSFELHCVLFAELAQASGMPPSAMPANGLPASGATLLQ